MKLAVIQFYFDSREDGTSAFFPPEAEQRS